MKERERKSTDNEFEQPRKHYSSNSNLCVTFENLIICSHSNPPRQVSPYSMNPKLNKLLSDELVLSIVGDRLRVLENRFHTSLGFATMRSLSSINHAIVEDSIVANFWV